MAAALSHYALASTRLARHNSSTVHIELIQLNPSTKDHRPSPWILAFSPEVSGPTWLGRIATGVKAEGAEPQTDGRPSGLRHTRSPGGGHAEPLAASPGGGHTEPVEMAASRGGAAPPKKGFGLSASGAGCASTTFGCLLANGFEKKEEAAAPPVGAATPATVLGWAAPTGGSGGAALRLQEMKRGCRSRAAGPPLYAE